MPPKHVRTRSTIDPILASYKELCSHYQAGLHAWRLPPHTLAYNLYTHIFSMYALDSLLLEGFGAGAYSAAVAALMAYRPPSRAEYSKFDCGMASAVYPTQYSIEL